MKSKKISLSIKQEYFDAVPRPTDEEYKAIEESIRFTGQNDPIVCNALGIILDGHTRFEICGNLNLIPKYRKIGFETEIEEFRYVVESNVNRRQLNAFQKVETFRFLLEILKKRAKENWVASLTNSGAPYASGGSALQYAKSIGLPRTCVHQVLNILNSNQEDIITRCRAGSMTITEGQRKIRERIDGTEKPQYEKNPTYQCPHCKKQMKKKELIRIG